ncbi:uncharacterized protein KY384_006117 [Bacidia gigantensis]|uniref:uncharacterized protein n=1 Tax=Bacidia gigantensis TaxID=2732470 RepID=UPI001D057417|nr:uncharacterized protein KY384_006117 [Bacidia gigantensis]KAG8529480.1 hypothetical protein KY384_006117 [Bacidia gigantensis]
MANTSSDESDAQLGELHFEAEEPRERPIDDTPVAPSHVIDDDDDDDPQIALADADLTTQDSLGADLDERTRHYIAKNGIAILVPPVKRQWEYQVYEEPFVMEIVEEYEDNDEVSYLVRFEDGSDETVPFDELLQLEGGSEAIADFNAHEPSDSDVVAAAPTRKSTRPTQKKSSSKTFSGLLDSSEEDEFVTMSFTGPSRNKRQSSSTKTSKARRPVRRLPKRSFQSTMSSDLEPSSEDSDLVFKKRKTGQQGTRSTRAAAQKRVNYNDAAGLEELDSDTSSGSGRRNSRRGRRGRPRASLVLKPPRRPSPEGARRSGRNALFSRSMREVDEDNIPEQGFTSNSIKYTGAKEHFKRLPENDPFRDRHCQTCDVCYEVGDNEERGRMVFCQGCTLAYHQKCLGHRGSRDHLVTKVDERDFVLQCRRCVNLAKVKDSTAPNQSKCFECDKNGPTSNPFRERKTVKQEQKEREENDGEDPIVDVDPGLVNNYENVLFRCLACYRACHLHHLEQRDDLGIASILGAGDREKAERRLKEYSRDWRCKLCAEAPAEVDGLVAWRPLHIESYQHGTTTDMVEEDNKEYLVKWKKLPHTKITWMPGPWVWGMTSATMRKAFAKRDNEHNLPKMTTDEAVPEEFMRVDIVFDIEYTNVVNLHTLDVDLKRIKEVDKALVKFKGLGYEDTVWIEPPQPNEAERYQDWKGAYEEWVLGMHITLPIPKTLSSHLYRIRKQSFDQHYALKTQPESLTGGKLMDYQLEGINWLHYQWFRQQNAILADEMGLGKTIQIIGFLANLKETHGCWPFLVVVPNSTCPNWRREIKQWAPKLRVVSYYGSSEARKLAAKHELFPNGPKDLRCHVVVTSYDAAQDGEFRQVFRGVRWQGLIVDEGQRLKNDKSILYGSLNALRAPFKVLLTGTPLQNNARELFNLLQFLDPSQDAEKMDEHYMDLDAEKVKELHEKLKPVFLRRTKAQVLSFLPPMAQVIVPVSLSILQKKLYRSILAKNPDLIKSIIGSSRKSLKQNERANLNNILMQLRKCLCHPFVYSKQIEERSRDPIVSHRNLVDASSKLQLLEMMLPRLQDRGHRVLIFSQFLDMLDIIEDFLDGIGLLHQRLDGSMSSLQKQRRIDEFNAKGSSLFAFLLSTRAGGVGINLATADTVIILDPDFNPHQDIQALSRAHRIGQEKKVLVFQLTTRSTAEEKIMQIGKKKMMLDHVLIEQMAAEDDAGMDLESILRHGTEAIFADDDDTQDIKYDIASIDKLLDRSQIENTKADNDKSAESQFSFAKVWVNDKGALEEGLQDVTEGEPDPSLWDKILKQRELEAAEEAAMHEKEFGRGRRRREMVDYSGGAGDDVPDASPSHTRVSRRSAESDSDTDFQASGDESDDANMPDGDGEDAANELHEPKERPSKSALVDSRSFRRAELPLLTPRGAALTNGRAGSVESDDGQYHPCLACGEKHDTGYCPLKLAGVEICNLCGLAHYGQARTCPHLNSVTQLRAMNESIKRSREPHDLKVLAKKRIVGIIGDLNQRKRKKHEAQQMHPRRDLPNLQPPHMSNGGIAPPKMQPNGEHMSPYFTMNGEKENNQFRGIPPPQIT